MNTVWRPSLIATLAVVLAACSNSPSTDDASTGGTAVATSSTIADIYLVSHQPGTGEFVGALVDVSAHTCEQNADGWRVTGTTTNPTANPVDYRIYISLLDGVSVTRALVETEVLAVPAGGTGEFDTVIAMPEADLRCVLRVERRAVDAGG